MIYEPDYYWASTLKGIYFPNCSFWSATKQRASSWVWQSLIEGRDFLKSQGRWAIGAGTEIDITQDKWLANGAVVELNPGVQCSKVSELITSDHCWDLNKLRSFLTPASAMAAMQTPISWSCPGDVFFWPFTNNGAYSVKTGYKVIAKSKQTPNTQPSSSTTMPPELWNLIWGACIPQKIKHFMWKLCHNAVAVKGNMARKRISREDTCPICCNDQETVEHAILLCPWT